MKKLCDHESNRNGRTYVYDDTEAHSRPAGLGPGTRPFGSIKDESLIFPWRKFPVRNVFTFQDLHHLWRWCSDRWHSRRAKVWREKRSVSWKTLLKWMICGGTPFLGNHHMYEYGLMWVWQTHVSEALESPWVCFWACHIVLFWRLASMQVMGKGGLLLRDTDTQCSNAHEVTFCAEYVRFAQRTWHVEKTTRYWRPQCEKTSPTFEVKTQLAFVEWSPDGKNILFCTLNGEARRMGFWRLMYARMTEFLVSSRVAFDTCRSFQSQFCAANWNFPTTSRAFWFARS